jgi:hypothetical protein
LNYLKFPVNPPYLKTLKPVLNGLGLPIKEYYTTGDVCKVLKIKPDTFRHRLKKGYYHEPMKMGNKRKFTEMEIREILNKSKALIRKGILASGKN